MIVTDVRVMRADHHRAHHALRRAIGEPLTVDADPPAAGPEVELTMHGPAAAVRDALERQGVTVLAIRERDVHPRHGTPATEVLEEYHRHSRGLLATVLDWMRRR